VVKGHADRLTGLWCISLGCPASITTFFRQWRMLSMAGTRATIFARPLEPPASPIRRYDERYANDDNRLHKAEHIKSAKFEPCESERDKYAGADTVQGVSV